MPDLNAQSIEWLRSAIAWALQLADNQEHSLIGSFLADALHLAEELPGSGGGHKFCP
jgi:hypothetical protein